jgi:hypothetical protein
MTERELLDAIRRLAFGDYPPDDALRRVRDLFRTVEGEVEE